MHTIIITTTTILTVTWKLKQYLESQRFKINKTREEQ
jgi:hypothetical protein